MQQPEHFDENEHHRLEQIALLTFHYKQDLKLAMQSYARVHKAAIYAWLIVFAVMSYFLHSVLLTGNADSTAYILALVVSTILAFIVCKLIVEFHPLRRTAARYWRGSNERKQQIKKLQNETLE